MDCLNGYVADPPLPSLAETLLEPLRRPPLTIPTGPHAMGLQMFQLLTGVKFRGYRRCQPLSKDRDH